MIVYADTGFLFSLYSPDAHTARAMKIMESRAEALAYAWLHQLELRNALRLAVFRKQITASECAASLNLVLADLAEGILTHVSPPMNEVALEAERLSAGYSQKLGVRSLDILHVAAALVVGAPQFLTFDKRQDALAKAAGLKVNSI